MERTNHSFTFKTVATKLAHDDLWESAAAAMCALLEGYLNNELKGAGLPGPDFSRDIKGRYWPVRKDRAQEEKPDLIDGVLVGGLEDWIAEGAKPTRDPPIEPLPVEAWKRARALWSPDTAGGEDADPEDLVREPLEEFTDVFRIAYIENLRVPRKSLLRWLRWLKKRNIPGWLLQPKAEPTQESEDPSFIKKGRPSYRNEIHAAYCALRDAGEIRPEQDIKEMVPKIQARAMEIIPGKRDKAGLSYETIRTAIADLLGADRKELFRAQAGA